MPDVEHHTACYLRDLLVTRAHRDPTMTTFLTCWAYEELWHGEAIARVLAATTSRRGGRPAGGDRRLLFGLGRVVPGNAFHRQVEEALQLGVQVL